jgi:hypothetical protein
VASFKKKETLFTMPADDDHHHHHHRTAKCTGLPFLMWYMWKRRNASSATKYGPTTNTPGATPHYSRSDSRGHGGGRPRRHTEEIFTDYTSFDSLLDDKAPPHKQRSLEAIEAGNEPRAVHSLPPQASTISGSSGAALVSYCRTSACILFVDLEFFVWDEGC